MFDHSLAYITDSQHCHLNRLPLPITDILLEGDWIINIVFTHTENPSRMENLSTHLPTHQPIPKILKSYSGETCYTYTSKFFSIVDIFWTTITSATNCSLNQYIFSAWCFLTGVNWGGGGGYESGQAHLHYLHRDVDNPTAVPTSFIIAMMRMNSLKQAASAMTFACIMLVVISV